MTSPSLADMTPRFQEHYDLLLAERNSLRAENARLRELMEHAATELEALDEETALAQARDLRAALTGDNP